jgi:hypothetical protein
MAVAPVAPGSAATPMHAPGVPVSGGGIPVLSRAGAATSMHAPGVPDVPAGGADGAVRWRGGAREPPARLAGDHPRELARSRPVERCAGGWAARELHEPWSRRRGRAVSPRAKRRHLGWRERTENHQQRHER